MNLLWPLLLCCNTMTNTMHDQLPTYVNERSANYATIQLDVKSSQYLPWVPLKFVIMLKSY